MFLVLGVVELLLLLQLVLGSVALAQTSRDVSGVLFVSYLVGRGARAAGRRVLVARGAHPGRHGGAGGRRPHGGRARAAPGRDLERRLVRDLSSGWGRVLVFVYGVFAVAATGRSLVQLGTDADRAPLAYSLSLVAAVIYLVATTCLLLGGRAGLAGRCDRVLGRAGGRADGRHAQLRRHRPLPRQDRLVALRAGLRLPAAGPAVRRVWPGCGPTDPTLPESTSGAKSIASACR